jgi:predicted RNase H-like HicB family nuclease
LGELKLKLNRTSIVKGAKSWNISPIFIKDRDSDYGVSFPDFPGCITAGKTLDETSRIAGEALALHIRGMIEDGDAVPEPSKLDDAAKDAAKRHDGDHPHTTKYFAPG